jgi:hypothetical protein
MSKVLFTVFSFHLFQLFLQNVDGQENSQVPFSELLFSEVFEHVRVVYNAPETPSKPDKDEQLMGVSLRR